MINSFNLYPYGYYILYISCIVTLFFLYRLIKNTLLFAKEVANKKTMIQNIQLNSSSFLQKQQLLNYKKSKKEKSLLPLLLLSFSIYQEYKNDANDGIGSTFKSFNTAYRRQKLHNRINKLFH